MKQYKLRKRIAWLNEKEGKQLISLYIPAGASVEKVVASLKQTPDCDKLPHAQCDLQETALTRITRFVRQKKALPENGQAIFAGFLTAENEAFHIEEIVPPEPIANYLLEVNSHFRLQPLREMLRENKIVGLIALDSKNASFGLLEGERLEHVDNISSGIPGKTRKGGQSQRRYERERDMEVTAFFHRVAEHAQEAFLSTRRITVLLVGGPGATKTDFLKGSFLNYELENVLLDYVDTQSAHKEAFREILVKSEEKLKRMCEPDQRKIMQRLMSELAKQKGLATYGLYSVLEVLKKGAADVVLVNDDVGIVEVVAVCKTCGQTERELATENRLQILKELTSTRCANCNNLQYEIREEDIVDVLEDAASQTDARVEVISSMSPEKESLAALGGVAALLRYGPS